MYLGFGIFLFLILLLSFSGIFFLNRLSDDSKSIISDNYNSVNYSMLMLKELDNIFLFQTQLLNANLEETAKDSIYSLISTHKKRFDKIYIQQKNNITEPGENILMKKVSANYSRFINKIEKLSHEKKEFNEELEITNSYKVLKNSINEIYLLNINAILKKSDVAENTASTVITYMSIITVLSLIITIVFIYYFPGYLIAPIKELTNKIKAVSDKSFDQRVEIKANDEIGELSESFNLMAERLKEFEESHLDQLLLEKYRMETLVFGLNDGVLLLDEKNNVLLINSIAEEIFNLKSHDILNKNINRFADESEILKYVLTLVAEKNTSGKPLKINKNNTEEYYSAEYIEIKRNNIHVNQNKILGLVLYLKNVTSFEKRDLAKTNMLATVSHELKTPVSSINLSLKLLNDSRIGILNPEQEKLLQSIQLQNKRLLNVINEILDYSQVETGKINLSIDNVDPAQIIEIATFALMVFLNEKEIELKVDIEKEIPFIRADLEKTIWVLVNILSNAIRYSPMKEKIILTAAKEKNYVIFSVEDFGAGIPPEDKERIFQKFVKDKVNFNRGTGLGLAIAKEFVESQGGRIWAVSEINRGSKFFFKLPIAN